MWRNWYTRTLQERMNFVLESSSLSMPTYIANTRCWSARYIVLDVALFRFWSIAEFLAALFFEFRIFFANHLELFVVLFF